MFKNKLILIILCSILVSNSYSVKKEELNQEYVNNVLRDAHKLKEEIVSEIKELNNRLENIPDTPENAADRALFIELIHAKNMIVERISMKVQHINEQVKDINALLK